MGRACGASPGSAGGDAEDVNLALQRRRAGPYARAAGAASPLARGRLPRCISAIAARALLASAACPAQPVRGHGITHPEHVRDVRALGLAIRA